MKKTTTKKAAKPKYKQGETLGTVEKIKSKHELIADKIIESLEANIIPWKKPWTALSPKNLSSMKEYRGINHILLSMIPTKYPYFLTFKQAKDLGGSVLKGSKSVPVFFYSSITKNKDVETNEEKPSHNDSFWFMKQYSVFTLEQIDGIKLDELIDPVIDFTPVMTAENLIKAFLDSQNLKVYPAQNAAYSPTQDHIVMPQKDQFHSVDSYYSTIFHEMIHSTGSEKRLKRAGFSIGEYHRFGSKGYAFEELVAEFGAAMLASYCGVDTSLESGQNAAYIKSWMKNIKEDPTICYKAASKAQAAVDFILKEAGFNVFGESDETLNEEAV
jgi:antirestriction protein ArdC